MQTQQQNKLFPVFLKLENFRVLIVGGGKVAGEKISAILNNSPATEITLVAPQVSAEITEWKSKFTNVNISKREFEENDLNEVDFVIVAVNNKETSLRIKQLAEQRKLITNVADTPEQCDFYLGSIVQKGDLKIAISTNGKSPTFAKRVKETLNDAIPNDVQLIVDKLHSVRGQLKGDFAYKVSKLNEISAVLKNDTNTKKKRVSNKRILVYSITAPILLIAGYLLAICLPPQALGGIASDLFNSVDSSILIFILAGFTAQMIDGALGMAYGVTATTFLLGAGVPPAASSASVHASEIFTSGVSGLMHLKFGNVNTKLFRTLLLPGILGAILGAYVLSSLEDYNYILKPLVSTYTLILGLIIIFKALKKDKAIREKIKRIFPLAFVGGLLDSIGGGGWGPIVSSTLIAKGRNARFTIGSVNLAEFFVSLASSVTFFTLIGITHWAIIVGLIIGGTIAAPIAAWLANKIPTKTIMILVGVVVIITSLKRIFF